MNEAIPRTTLPVAWRATYILQQVTVLLVAGAAFLFATWGSPVYQALLARLPDLVIPPGIPLPVRFAVPLLVPLLLGLPILVTRQRAPILLWLGVMAVLCALSVVEVSRLNWAAFVSGLAFRIESGPVPLVRTVAGLVVLLAGLMLMAHQGTSRTLQHLAERGVPLPQLVATRDGLLGLERFLHLGLLGAGIVLTIVAAVSMAATEVAPEGGGTILPLVWTGLLLALIVGALALGTWRRLGAPGEDESPPQRL